MFSYGWKFLVEARSAACCSYISHKWPVSCVAQCSSVQLKLWTKKERTENVSPTHCCRCVVCLSKVKLYKSFPPAACEFENWRAIYTLKSCYDLEMLFLTLIFKPKAFLSLLHADHLIVVPSICHLICLQSALQNWVSIYSPELSNSYCWV